MSSASRYAWLTARMLKNEREGKKGLAQHGYGLADYGVGQHCEVCGSFMPPTSSDATSEKGNLSDVLREGLGWWWPTPARVSRQILDRALSKRPV